MLTADPEGFPLGLAELGLKKPKAGGENTRVAAETESSPAQRPRSGLADLRRPEHGSPAALGPPTQLTDAPEGQAAWTGDGHEPPPGAQRACTAAPATRHEVSDLACTSGQVLF